MKKVENVVVALFSALAVLWLAAQAWKVGEWAYWERDRQAMSPPAPLQRRLEALSRKHAEEIKTWPADDLAGFVGHATLERRNLYHEFGLRLLPAQEELADNYERFLRWQNGR
jgi:hypothetical protein